MINACVLTSAVVTVDFPLCRDGDRRHSEVSQLRRLAKSQNHGFRAGSYAVLFLTMAVLCLGAHADPPLHPQFVAAQSVVPTGSLSYPYRCAVDANGNIYISNTQANSVLKETLSNGTYTESVVVSTGLATPYGIAVDTSGDVFIVDNGHNRVVKETPSGNGYTQSVVSTTTPLSYPSGIAVDASGTLYIADTGGGEILVEAPSGASYNETALTYSSNFAQITGIAVDPSGNIYVTDIDNQAVYKETYSAGSYTPSTIPTSGLNYPYDLTVDANGDVYISDFSNKRIVEETPSDGSYIQSVFPTYNLGGALGIAIDASGNLYLADTFGFDIKKLTVSGGNFGPVNVNTTAGPIYMLFDFAGGGIGDTVTLTGTSTPTLGVTGLDFSSASSGSGLCSATSYSAGDSCTVAVSVDPAVPGLRVGAAQLVGATGVLAQGPLEATGVGPQINFLSESTFFEFQVIPVAGPPTYNVTEPVDAAVDASGNVYAADYVNDAIYEFTLSGGVYTQSTVVSGLNNPEAVALDGAGNVYVVDSGNNQILKETNFGGVWTGTAVATGLNFPTGIAVDWLGDVYFSSFDDGAVYKLTLSGGVYTQSTVVTGLNQPRKIAIDGSGNVYIADTGNSRVVMETLLSGGGYTQTVLGSGMQYPYGVAVDASGSVYVADTGHDDILKETLSNGVYTQSEWIPGPTAPAITLDGYGNIYFPDVDAIVFKIDYNVLPTLTFASSELGTQSVDSPIGFSVINSGNAPLSLSVPSTGTNPSVATGFTIDSSSTCPTVSSSGSAATIAAGATCTYAMDFIPQAVGADSGALVLSDNNLYQSAPTQSISLAGTGTAAPSTTTATSATAVYSPSAQTVMLSATVSSDYGTVNAGTVTFTLMQSSTVVGSATTSSTLSNGTASVSYTLPGGTAAGTYTIAAVFNAGGAFAGSSDNTQTLVVSKASQAINFTQPMTPQTYAAGLTIPLSATGGGSGNPVVFTVDGSSSGAGTITGSTLTVTSAGTLVIDANQAANGNYTTATQAHVTVVISKAAQTISFTQPMTPQTYAPGLTVPLSVTGGSSSNAVALTLDESSTGTGTISGSTLTVTGAGTLVIDANQAGNGDYTAATQAQVTVVINKAAQTINFTQPATPQTFTPGLTIALNATGGASGDAIVFALDGASTGTGTISGSTLTVTGEGTFVIDANQAGNGNYSAATQAQVTVVVSKAAQTISFAAPATPVTYGVAPITLAATGGASGNAVIFSVISGPGSISGSKLTITGAGTVVVAANQAGNANYTAAAQVTNSIVVNMATPTVSLVANANPVLVTNAVTFTATVASTAGSPDGSVNFLDGTTLLEAVPLSSGTASYTTSSLAAATHSITAVYSGDTNFASVTSSAVSEVVQDFSLSIPGSGGSGSSGPPSQTVFPGGTATYTLSLGPSNGATFPAPVTLSLSGLPPGATGTLTPSTLPAGSSLTNVTLTIQLPQVTASVDEKQAPGRRIPPALWGILLLPFAGKLRRKGKRLGRAVSLLLLMAAGIAAAVGLNGCGSTSGFFGQQPESYTVTITATSGSLSHSTTLTLNVE